MSKTRFNRKWWFRYIRGYNWFSHRYWWFNWALWLFFFMLCLFMMCTPHNLFKKDPCIIADLSASTDSIENALISCCPCQPDSISVPDSLTMDCPDRVLVFQVCNSNKALDDDFEVYLNGTGIGMLRLNKNDDIGSVFMATETPDIMIKEGDFECPISKMEVYRFNPSLVKRGMNKIELKNIKNNRNSNRGVIQIRNYLLDGVYLSSPCIVKDLSYQMESGMNFSVRFKYDKCCE